MIVCIVSHQHIDLVCQGHRHDDNDDVDDDYNDGDDGHDDDSHKDNYDDKGNRSELRS